LTPHTINLRGLLTKASNSKVPALLKKWITLSYIFLPDYIKKFAVEQRLITVALGSTEAAIHTSTRMENARPDPSGRVGGIFYGPPKVRTDLPWKLDGVL
jgi:hypothetical protein